MGERGEQGPGATSLQGTVAGSRGTRLAPGVWGLWRLPLHSVPTQPPMWVGTQTMPLSSDNDLGVSGQVRPQCSPWWGMLVLASRSSLSLGLGQPASEGALQVRLLGLPPP